MSLVLLLTVAAALLAAGYLLGRARPWAHLATWVDWQVHAGHWWLATRLRQTVIAVLFAVTWPRTAWTAWCRRGGPAAPPLRFDSLFLTSPDKDKDTDS